MAKYKGYDFCGWATRNDLRCSDGRTIRSGAFAHQDGQKVPLVWSHNHDSPEAVLGHGFLENRPEGVFFYGYFNDSELAQAAKRDVAHGDITSLSIWANQLKQKAGDVLHGSIKEVSLVLAGANIGAQITYPVIVHGEDSEINMDEAYIYVGEEYGKLYIAHADDSDGTEHNGGNSMDENKTVQDVLDTMDEDQLKVLSYLVAKAAAGGLDEDDDEIDEDEIEHGDDDVTIQDVLDTMDDDQLEVLSYLVEKAAEDADDEDDDEDADEDDEDEDDEDYDDDGDDDGEVEHDDMDDDMTVEDVLDTMDDDQLEVVNFLIDAAVEDAVDEILEDEDLEHYDFGGDYMNFNAFDAGMVPDDYISHSEQQDIIATAKKLGSLKKGLEVYAEENELSHDDLKAVSGFTSYPSGSGSVPANVDALFPEYRDVRPGAPEIVTNDQAWVKAVLAKVHKSPFSRIRTSSVDVRGIEEIRARGYAKGKEKVLAANYAVAKRATDPQTVYVRSALNHDDIVDITDFDYVDYQYKIDRMQLELELARAILIGDGRDDASADKISPDHIRNIWQDADLYTIHKTLDATPAANDPGFGENYVYAQAMEAALLDAKIDYRGTGTGDMFCTQQFFNKLMLAKDLNGRRLYNNKNELATALDVNAVYPVSEMANLTRTTGSGSSEKTLRPLAIIGNLADYALGCTKGGEIVHRNQYDIDFNQEKSLLETRVSGATTKLYSFIVIEEEVA